MPENKTRFVLVCQQSFAVAVVGAVGLSAIGVIDLEVVSPDREAAASAAVTALVSSAPVEPTVRSVPMLATATGQSKLGPKSRTSASAPQEIRAVSGVEPVTGYATVGVTWDGDQVPAEDEVTVEVRTRATGSWSAWQPMHYDGDHGPDPAAQAPSEVRSGTDAVVVGDVDAVQVRAVTTSGAPLEGLALAVVDPGEDVAPHQASPAIDTAEKSTSGLELSAKRGAPRPKIFSRAQWGADERLRDGSPSYGEIHAGFVHHTVNANDYRRAEVPEILRGIYAYHTQSRGWSDVGYNFLVDRFGRIWEGRAGGVRRPVVGAHTLGYNSDSFAMSAIGNFETVRPTRALVNAYARLMAWKLGRHGINAADTRVFVTDRYFQAINGHRDAGSTACPGRYLYEALPKIRRNAAALQRHPRPDPEPEPDPTPAVPTRKLHLDVSGSSWPDLVVRDPRTKHAVVVRTGGQVSFESPLMAAKRWRHRKLVAAPGDVNGDGYADIVARSTTGATSVFAGTPSGRLGAELATMSRRFATVDQLTGVGDFDEDGRNDLVGRTSAGHRLVLFRGRGDGAFEKPRRLAHRWGGYNLTTGVGDFDGDGHVDLLARSRGRLYLVPGTGGGIARPVLLGRKWGHLDVITGRGDVTGDRVPDVVVRVRKTGLTYVHPGDGAGELTGRIGGWRQFRQQRWLAVVGQLAGNGKADVVGINRGGGVRVYPHTGRRNVAGTIDTGVPLSGIDLLLNVGDWNADGRGDIMTRDASSGALHLRAGVRGNRFADPTLVRKRFAGVNRLAPVGDYNRDGWPDLVGTGPKGGERVYLNNGRNGIARSVALRATVPGRDQVGLGFWDGDKVPDTAIRRRNGALWVWSSATGETTKVGTGLRRYDWFVGPGDVDGNGRSDIVVRSRRSGALLLLPATAAGFGEPRLIDGGFGGYDSGS
jgi:hypothetical protein